MDLINNIFQWVVFSSLTSSIFILVILLLRKILNYKINPNFIHLLWLLLIIKLILPINIKSQFSFYNIFNSKENNISSFVDTSKNNYIPSTQSAVNNHRKPYKTIETIKQDFNFEKIESNNKTLNIFSLLWFNGALVFGLIFLLAYFKLKQARKEMIKVTDRDILNLFYQIKDKLNIKKEILLLTGDSFNNSFITGLKKPIIYLPRKYLKELQLFNIENTLYHELIHFKRGDLIVNFLQVTAFIIHWFNPLLWIIMSTIKEDREIACDYSTMNKLKDKNPLNYGMTIIELTKIDSNTCRNLNTLFAISFINKESLIKRRIKMIKKFKKPSKTIKIVTALAFILVGVIFLTNSNRGQSKYILNSNSAYGSGNLTGVYDLKDGLDYIDHDIKIPNDFVDKYIFHSFMKHDNIYSLQYNLDHKKYELLGDKNTYFMFHISENNLENLFKNLLQKENFKVRNKKIDKFNLTVISHEIDKTYQNINYYILKDKDLYYVLEEQVTFSFPDSHASITLPTITLTDKGINDYIKDNYNNFEDISPYIDKANLSYRDIEKTIQSLRKIDSIDFNKYRSQAADGIKPILTSEDISFAEKSIDGKFLSPYNLGNGFEISNMEIYNSNNISEPTISENNPTNTSILTSYYNHDLKIILNLEQGQSKTLNDDYSSASKHFDKIKIKNIDIYHMEKENPADPSLNTYEYIWKIKDSFIYKTTFSNYKNKSFKPIDIIEDLVEKSKNIN